MATWNQIKTDTQALLDKTQRVIDFYSNTSSEQTYRFKVFADDSDTTGLGFEWTGEGGGDAYWNAWRTANPTLNGSNGTDLQNIWYHMWSAHFNEDITKDGNAKSIGELIAMQQAQHDEYTILLNNAQAQIDAGNGDVDPEA